jgi:hypothetical protein
VEEHPVGSSKLQIAKAENINQQTKEKNLKPLDSLNV